MALTEEVRQAIIALADKNGGRLTPEEVVAAARATDSPLHSSFEWNDRRAAEKHRIAVACGLIRSVRIEVTVTELTAPIRAPMFGRLVDEGGYASVAYLSQDEDRARAAAVAEFQKASAALKHAHRLAIELNLGSEAVATVESLIRSVLTAGTRIFPTGPAQ